MTTSTVYTTWTLIGAGVSLRQSVGEALAEYISDYDFDGLVDAYHRAIDAALPDSVFLSGDEFIGPAYEEDQDFDGYPLTDDGDLDIKEIVESIDFWALAEKYDTTT